MSWQALLVHLAGHSGGQTLGQRSTKADSVQNKLIHPYYPRGGDGGRLVLRSHGCMSARQHLVFQLQSEDEVRFFFVIMIKINLMTYLAASCLLKSYFWLISWNILGFGWATIWTDVAIVESQTRSIRRPSLTVEEPAKIRALSVRFTQLYYIRGCVCVCVCVGAVDWWGGRGWWYSPLPLEAACAHTSVYYSPASLGPAPLLLLSPAPSSH